jgi:hypothetical protein
MRGKRWVLKQHVISVNDHSARANVFEVPGGYAIPVTFAENTSEVTVILRDLLDMHERITGITVFHPGEAKTSSVQERTIGQETRIVVPVQRGCALVKLACRSVAGNGSDHAA